jgi:hypothetical protein
MSGSHFVDKRLDQVFFGEVLLVAHDVGGKKFQWNLLVIGGGVVAVFNAAEILSVRDNGEQGERNHFVVRETIYSRIAIDGIYVMDKNFWMIHVFEISTNWPSFHLPGSHE